MVVEATYEIRSSRAGTIIAVARVGGRSEPQETTMGFAIGELFADWLAPGYRDAYLASWDDLFSAAGAQRSFDTVFASDSRSWSGHLHEESVIDGDDLVIVSTVDELAVVPVAASRVAPTEEAEPDTKRDGGDDTAAEPNAVALASLATSETETNEPSTSRTRTEAAVGFPGAGELAILALIVVVATLFRFVEIAALPTGLHGDEAITGIEGWRVQKDGFIGFYTGSGLGQPTLMYYPWALVQWIFGDGVATLRGFAAVGGVMSVVLVWLTTRRRFGAASALGAAATLAILVWSIHYSRIAFSLAWWPVFALVALYLLDRAIEKNTGALWAMSGVAVGIGVYVYSAHWVFGFAVAVFVVGWMIWNAKALKDYGRGLAIFVASGLLTVAPMLWLLVSSDYSNHVETIGIQTTPEWQSAGFGGKIGLLADGYWFAWRQLIKPTNIDYSDGAGLINPIGLPLLILAVVGVGIAAWRFRSRYLAMTLVVIALMPVATAMTSLGHGPVRRDFAMAPLLALMIGVFLGALWEQASARFTPFVSSVIIAAPIVLFALSSRSAYFGTFQNNGAQKWIFAAELVGPAEVMDEFGDDVFVNFYSGRHSFYYESLRYLAPTSAGIDRSDEFGENTSFEPWPDDVRPQLFVLIGPYVERLEDLKATTPGSIVRSGKSGDVPFVAYLAS